MGLPFDTLGNSAPILVLLLLMSLVSIGIIIAKIVQLWPAAAGASNRSAALQEWTGGDRTAASRRIAASRVPADRVLHFAMSSLERGVAAGPLERELERRGNEEVSKLNTLIRLLELIAMVSPLLGLLGTVLGMIQSFQDLELAQGAANASILAGGIWQALLTTAAGLLVAIPAAVAAGLFAARIDRTAQTIEGAVSELMLIESTR
ncbi:MotA/TolQ/ExbB proton channel family protein [Epibacterium ulvae]|uniref:MotA/TolQ/ExbB proton channel family protein n=1 Tax=Epibacterium ulvae TaxID=1156985 RepID=UPI001BFBF913|nr:MotA/TolQ/ExbB proton channel family protein [Epibacterium ulvae]MBT8155459.1 MotA/TolQ/ExbB proton channel family protein [Epibacterium ulvae]